MVAPDDGIVVGMPYVYIVRCVDDSLYIGVANDIERRLAKHNEGTASSFTARRLPVAVVYSEEHATRTKAHLRERQLKRWTRQKKEALIRGDTAALKRPSAK